jgi:hypothetical protein
MGGPVVFFIYKSPHEGVMEKRWCDRRDLHVGVDVYQKGGLVGTCLSHDIGLGGTFLQIENPSGMQKDMEVQLVFSLLKDNHQTRHKINARVARVAGDGVGFKFCDFDTGVFRSLQEIMAYRRARAVGENGSATH